MKQNAELIDPKEIRQKLGMNQQTFWGLLGVTQSGGSRYEAGRSMPRPVEELLRLVHIESVDIRKIRKEDIDIIDYIKKTNSALYKELKKEARAWAKSNK